MFSAALLQWVSQMGEYAAKARRYLIYPMLRPKGKELTLLVLCALFLATVYVFMFSSPETSNTVVLSENYIRSSDKLVLAVTQQLNTTTPVIQKSSKTIAGVLVICASRPAAIRNHLKQLLELRPNQQEFPITVSQDGNNEEVKQIVLAKIDNNNLQFWRHEREKTVRSKTYTYIAAHYKWALDKMFKDNGYDYVIVTEDDLDLSPDFFSYFAWAKKILSADPTLLCASAWNDNGIPSLIDTTENAKVWRTDFFPGLGWMLSRQTWEELSSQWPEAYWDDWLRRPEIRKNRSCLRPEIPRTSHNMALAGKGTSGGLFKSFLNSIKHNKEAVDFSLVPIEPLLRKNFDEGLMTAIKEAREIPFDDIKSFNFDPQNSYRVVFTGMRQWVSISKHMGIMTDVRGGMPRTAYQGIVPVMYKSCRVYLISNELNIEDISSFVYNKDWEAMVRYLEFAAIYCKPTKYTGRCDPNSDEMKDWFKRKGQSRKLAGWGKMIVV